VATSDFDVFLMSNLRPKRTGLPFVVWISQQQGDAQSGVWVKVSRHLVAIPSDMATVAISPTVHVIEGTMNASDLVSLTEWVELNRDVLVKHWDGEIADSKEAIDAIQPIQHIDQP
jgi:hypothetical protein